jgi:hypothetical protein
VDNNYLDLGMSKSGFIHTLPSGRLTRYTGGLPSIITASSVPSKLVIFSLYSDLLPATTPVVQHFQTFGHLKISI